MAAKKQSELGLKKEVEAAIAVVFGATIIVPLALFIIEKDKFVKFWAMQSILFVLAVVALETIFTATIVLIVLVPILMVAAFLLWLAMVYKAWMGDMWEVPIIGKISNSLIKKINF